MKRRYMMACDAVKLVDALIGLATLTYLRPGLHLKAAKYFARKAHERGEI